MPHQTVPFSPDWVTSDKLDIKAIYRRPRLTPFGQRVVDEAGRPAWDLTGALPVRRHMDWLKKGFEYVSLATWQDVRDAGNTLTAQGYKAADFSDAYETIGDFDRRPFKVQQYLAVLATDDTAAYGRMAELVKLHGSEMVQEIMRASHPGYVLPEALRDIQAPVETEDTDDVTGVEVSSEAPVRKRRGRPPKALAIPTGDAA